MKRLFSRSALTVVTSAVVVAGALGAQEIELPGQDNTGFGTTSAEFLMLGAGARGTALGGSFAAIADDITALYYNPAGLALLTNSGAAFSTQDYVAGTRYTWAGVAFPMGGGERVVGFQVGTFGFSGQPIYTVANPDGDGSTYSVAETFFGFTYAQNFSDRFSAGGSVKFISDRLGDATASGAAFDLGTNFHAMLGGKMIRASFTIQNLGAALRHDGTGLDVGVVRVQPPNTPDQPQDPAAARLTANAFNLPTTFRVGLAYELVSSQNNRVTLLSQFVQPNNTDIMAGGGLEWALTNLGNSGFGVVARGSYTFQPDNDLSPSETAVGFATGLDSDENSDGLALGGGIEYGRGSFRLSVDYAYRDLGLLGTTNTLGATIGW